MRGAAPHFPSVLYVASCRSLRLTARGDLRGHVAADHLFAIAGQVRYEERCDHHRDYLVIIVSTFAFLVAPERQLILGLVMIAIGIIASYRPINRRTRVRQQRWHCLGSAHSEDRAAIGVVIAANLYARCGGVRRSAGPRHPHRRVDSTWMVAY